MLKVTPVEENVIVKLDPNSPLYEQVMAVEQRQEAAVKKAADVLAEEYGVPVEPVAYSPKAGGIVVTYLIKKQVTPVPEVTPETPNV